MVASSRTSQSIPFSATYTFDLRTINYEQVFKLVDLADAVFQAGPVVDLNVNGILGAEYSSTGIDAYFGIQGSGSAKTGISDPISLPEQSVEVYRYQALKWYQPGSSSTGSSSTDTPDSSTDTPDSSTGNPVSSMTESETEASSTGINGNGSSMGNQEDLSHHNSIPCGLIAVLCLLCMTQS